MKRRRSDHVPCNHENLLLITPSRGAVGGVGGGIERVSDAVMRVWHGQVQRIDMNVGPAPLDYSMSRKVSFTRHALRSALRQRPAVVLAIHLGLLPIAFLAARIGNSRVALMAHGTEVWGRLPWWERSLIRNVDARFASSSFTAHWLSVRSGARSVTVLPLPIDPRLQLTAVTQRDRDGRPPVLLTVSRLLPDHRYKGHFEIADALPLVLRERPDARWVVVGDGDDARTLADKCASLGIERAVTFEGRVSDARLAELYTHAAALVLPSVANVHSRPPTGEGFGLVYAEAGAFGTPSIVSSESGGALDIVEDGETGLTTPPGDAPALARAMLLLLEDTAFRARLGNQVRDRVLVRHTDERFAEALKEAIAAVVP